MNIGDRFAWIRAVLSANPRPSLAEAAVAVVLAEHFNEARGMAWPASRFIATLVRMDRSNIRRAIACLRTRGFIAQAEKRSRSQAFVLTMPEGVPQPPQRGLYDPLKGGSMTPSKGAARPPEQVFRSEAVGIPYSAANARGCAVAPPRTRGGQRQHGRRVPGAPVSI